MRLRNANMVILLFFLMVSLEASSQVLNDSTAQIVAYWNRGEQHIFDMELLNYSIQDNDTTITKHTKSKFSIAVVDSTNAGYTIEYRELSAEYLVEDSVSAQTRAALSGSFDRYPLRFTTDANGMLLDFVNWDALKEEIQSSGLLDTLKTRMQRQFRDDLKEANDTAYEFMDNLINSTTNLLLKKQTWLNGVSPILQLFSYNGRQLQLLHEYEGKARQTSIFDPNTPIDVDVSVFASQEHLDEELPQLVTINSSEIYNSDQLYQSFLKYMQQQLPQEEDVDLSLSPEAEHPYIGNELTLIIDTNFGWCVSLYNERVTRASGVTKYTTYSIDLSE